MACAWQRPVHLTILRDELKFASREDPRHIGLIDGKLQSPDRAIPNVCHGTGEWIYDTEVHRIGSQSRPVIKS